MSKGAAIAALRASMRRTPRLRVGQSVCQRTHTPRPDGPLGHGVVELHGDRRGS